MIDWSSPEYTANKAFQAEVAWVSIDCYDNADLPFVAGNNSSSSDSGKGKGSRLARRGDFEVEELWKRQSAATVNSYLWGCASLSLSPVCASLSARRGTRH